MAGKGGRQPLAEGADTIDRVTMQTLKDGRHQIVWFVRLPGEVRPRRQTTTGRGVTKGELQRRAHERARQLLEEARGTSGWTSKSPMSDYLERHVRPEVEGSPATRPRTKASYARLVSILEEECGGRTVGAFCNGNELVAMLQRVAAAHGTASAKQVRRFLRKHVLSPLYLDGAIPSANPLADVSIDYPDSFRAGGRTVKHGCAATRRVRPTLTATERARCVRWLLDDDCVATARAGGRVSREEAVRKRRALVELTALQATTGLRLAEALAITPEDVDLTGDYPLIHVRAEVSKTHEGRWAVIDPAWEREVGSRLARRVRETAPGAPLFGKPTVDPSVPLADGRGAEGRAWDENRVQRALRNVDTPEQKAADKARAEAREKHVKPPAWTKGIYARGDGLYHEMADALGIDKLHDCSTHVWRRTLNTEMKARGVPAEMCTQQFGHSTEMNEQSYTSPMEAQMVHDAMARHRVGEVLPFESRADMTRMAE